MGGANGSRECAPDDELRDTHHVRNDGDGFREGLSPSPVIASEAKQSISPFGGMKAGLLRRVAPRNDESSGRFCLTGKSLRVLPGCLSSPICKNISVFA